MKQSRGIQPLIQQILLAKFHDVGMLDRDTISKRKLQVDTKCDNVRKDRDVGMLGQITPKKTKPCSKYMMLGKFHDVGMLERNALSKTKPQIDTKCFTSSATRKKMPKDHNFPVVVVYSLVYSINMANIL
jgi:hypothetical protein